MFFFLVSLFLVVMMEMRDRTNNSDAWVLDEIESVLGFQFMNVIKTKRGRTLSSHILDFAVYENFTVCG